MPDMTSDQRIKEILDSPSASYWLKKTLTAALERDCIDAVNDCEVLFEILQMRATEKVAKLHNDALPFARQPRYT